MDLSTDRWLEEGDPRLAPSPDLALARTILAGYVPHDADQTRTRDRMLAFCDEHPDALHRSCLEGHLTAAAVLLDPERERILLTHHRKLGRWLQLGGHCDGDANLAAVALREAREESGIAVLRIAERPIDVDVHAIPARGDEPEHLHLDTRFVVLAPPDAVETVSDESLALGWFGPDDLGGIELDDSVRRLFRLVFERSSRAG